MYQISIITFFIATMFVGCISSLPNKETLTSSSVNVTSTNNVTRVSNENNTEVVTTSIAQTNVTKGESVKLNKTESPVVTQSPLNTKQKSSDEVQKKYQKDARKENERCNYKTETADMIKCHVTPHDDDDEDGVLATTLSSTTVTVKEDTTKMKKPLNEQNSTLNKLVYETVPPVTAGSTSLNNTESSNDDLQFNHTEITISSVEPLPIDNIRSIRPEGSLDVTKATNEDDNNKSMPTGIIALVTAVSFALAIIFVYVSVIAWKRYIEYRYGHRELLVNDLEFDTNDLRHFEL